jgi:uncharacterized protein (TIGR03067 family)
MSARLVLVFLIASVRFVSHAARALAFVAVLLTPARCVLWGFAPAPFPREGSSPATKADLQAIQGVWRVKGYFVAGRKIDSSDRRVKFAGQRLIFYSTRKNSPNQVEWTFALNVTCSQRRFDLPGTDAPAQGIYQMKNEVLTISIDLPGRARPRNFRPRSAHWHLVLERTRK